MKAIKTYVIFLIFLTILAITPVLAQSYNLASVNWIKYIELSEGYDYAYGTCIFGEYLAVVGHANWHPSLILLDRSTGYIVRKWVGEDNGYFYNCFPVGNVLYAVGSEGAIYAFDKDLNLLSKAEGPSDSYFFSITYDGEYLYIGGSILKDINGDGEKEWIWYIEKRTKSLKLISYKELYTGNWGYVEMRDLGINPVTDEIWAVGGYYDTSNTHHSLIVIFDKELRELKRIDYPYWNEYYLGWLWGMCFDNIGNAYVGSWGVAFYENGNILKVSWGGVAKLDKYGNVLKVNKDVAATEIAFINGLVYTFNDVYINNYRRHVLYVLDSELNIIEKHVLSENVNANSYFWLGRPCFDGKNIYVAGYDYALGKSRWVVYSIAVRPLPPITVSIEGLPSSYSIPIYINGIFSGYVQGGESKEFNVSEIKVTVKIGQSEIRTNDTIYKVMDDTLTVNPGERAVFRYYAWLYYVEVISNLAPTYGSGWYHSGELANVELNELKDNYYYTEGGKVRYIFQGWEVKKGSINPSSSSNFSFNVYEPITIQAKFGPPEYLVCIDNICNFYEKGSIIPAQQDIPTLGGLIIKRFEGYLDNYGNNFGKSIVVYSPLTLSSVYREELNLPLLSIIIVVVLIPSFLVWMNRNKIKIGKESGTIVKEAKGEEKTGTEVRELTKDELEKELSILNERLSRLEELYKKGEIEEYAYKKLKEEYESKKKEIEKKMKSH